MLAHGSVLGRLSGPLKYGALLRACLPDAWDIRVSLPAEVLAVVHMLAKSKQYWFCISSSYPAANPCVSHMQRRSITAG